MTCPGAIGLGAVLPGGTEAASGRVGPGADAWFRVTFIGNESPEFGPEIRLTSPQGARFDAFTTCGGSELPCGATGQARAVDEWSLTVSTTEAGYSLDYAAPLADSDGTVLLRVVASDGCADFELEARNRVVCTAGYQSCPVGGRCVVNLQRDVEHCGACDAPCSDAHVEQACFGGNCVGNCENTYADCNGDRRTDGCEVHIPTDPANCGACGTVCSLAHVAVAQCTGGQCTSTCAAGFDDCNDDKLSDGCETDLNTVLDCGACGNPCRAGFVCTSQQCRCDAAADCPGGACNGYGLCVCGTTTCSAGSTCATTSTGGTGGTTTVSCSG